MIPMVYHIKTGVYPKNEETSFVPAVQMVGQTEVRIPENPNGCKPVADQIQGPVNPIGAVLMGDGVTGTVQ